MSNSYPRQERVDYQTEALTAMVDARVAHYESGLEYIYEQTQGNLSYRTSRYEIDCASLTQHYNKNMHASIMTNTQETTRRIMIDAQDTLEMRVESMSGTMLSYIPRKDYEAWEGVRSAVTAYGVGTPETTEALNQASSQASRKAMRYALDITVWNGVKQVADARNIDAATRKQMIETELRRASGQSARRAMRQALDVRTLNRINHAAKFYMVGSAELSQELDGASTPAARRAMRYGLDGRVWNAALSTKNAYGPNSTQLWDAVGKASNKSAKHAMIRGLGLQKTTHREQPRQEQRPADQSSTYQEEDFLRGYFRRPDSKQAQLQKTAEARELVQKTASGANANRYAWLTSTDIEQVKIVLNTVRKLRADAVAKGEQLTDRNIYMKFRRAVEVGEDKQRPADEQKKHEARVQRFHILDALMGGHKGTIPFK